MAKPTQQFSLFGNRRTSMDLQTALQRSLVSGDFHCSIRNFAIVFKSHSVPIKKHYIKTAFDILVKIIT